MAHTAKKTNYHHGNLRTALIQTALTFLEESSPDSLSLRRLARQLNVSQTAVYSHFDNKTDLLAAIATHGFQIQADYLYDKMQDIRDPYGRIECFAMNYMRFAFENRALN